MLHRDVNPSSALMDVQYLAGFNWVFCIRLGYIKMDFKMVSLKMSQAVKDYDAVFSVVILNSILLQFCRFAFPYTWFCADSALRKGS